MTEPRGRLTVLAGPTAVGKGTVAAYVRTHHPEVWISVSVTTRHPRPGEVHGRHYWFVSDEEFDRLVAHGDLLEWAVVHKRARCGPPRAAGDRPAGRAAGAGDHAAGAVRVPQAAVVGGAGFFAGRARHRDG